MSNFTSLRRLTLGWNPCIFGGSRSAGMFGLPPTGLPKEQDIPFQVHSSVPLFFLRSLLYYSSPPFIWNPADPCRKETCWDWIHFFTAVPIDIREATIADTISHMTCMLCDAESHALENLPSYPTLLAGRPNWHLGWPDAQGEVLFSGETPGFFRYLMRSAWVSTHRQSFTRCALDIHRKCPSLEVLNCFTLRCSDSWYWTVDLTSSPLDVKFVFPVESPIQDTAVDTSVHSVPIVVGGLLDEVLSARNIIHGTVQQFM